MNTKILKIVFFTLTILASMSAMAQQYPDYVITVEGDSISCLISAGGTEYTDSATAAVEKIKPDRIREYYKNEQRRLYRAVYVNDSKLRTYLAYAEKGMINLYYLVVSYGFGNTTQTSIIWYVGKGADDRVYRIKSFGLLGSGKDDFAQLLKDNPQVYNKFLADNPGYKQLEKIVHLYNTGEAYDGTSDGAPLVPDRSYIITQKNDTVFCRIRNDYFTRKYMFKLAKQANFNVIDSANAREFFYSRDTSHFALVNEPGVPSKVFLKQLEKGKVNFYQKTLLSNDLILKELQSNLYISKGNGPLTLIGSRANSARKFEIKYAQLKIFFDAIADNDALLSSFKKAIGNSATGKEDVIRYFIQNYNFLNATNSTHGQATN